MGRGPLCLPTSVLGNTDRYGCLPCSLRGPRSFTNAINARPSKASLLPTPPQTHPPYRLSTYPPALPMDRIRHFKVVCRQRGFPLLEFPLILNHPNPDDPSVYASLFNSQHTLGSDFSCDHRVLPEPEKVDTEVCHEDRETLEGLIKRENTRCFLVPANQVEPDELYRCFVPQPEYNCEAFGFGVVVDRLEMLIMFKDDAGQRKVAISPSGPPPLFIRKKTLVCKTM